MAKTINPDGVHWKATAIQYMTLNNEKLEALQRVHKLHKEVPCTEAGECCQICDYCGYVYPCATIKALDGKQDG